MIYPKKSDTFLGYIKYDSPFLSVDLKVVADSSLGKRLLTNTYRYSSYKRRAVRRAAAPLPEYDSTFFLPREL